MRCRGARRILQAALDGELGARERAALDAHLAGCAACRAAAAEQRRLATALASLPTRDAVPAGLEEATWRRIRGELAAPAPQPQGPALRLAWWWLPLPAVAAIAAVLLLRAAPPRAPEMVATPAVRPAPAVEGAPGRMASRQPEAPATPASPKRQPAPAPAGAPAAPVPRVVASSVDLFLDMPILENLEKLENYEAIRTVDNGRDAGPEGSRG